MKNLMKMIMKRKGGAEEMSPEEMQAKMDVIQELLDLAGNSQGKNIAGKLQKVSVMAPSKEGLLEGMDKAEDLVEGSSESMEESEEIEPEMESGEAVSEMLSEKPEHSMSSEEDDSDEGLSFMEKRKRKMERMGKE